MESLRKLQETIDDMKDDLSNGNFIKILNNLKEVYDEISKSELHKLVGFITFTTVSRIDPTETLSGLTELKLAENSINYCVMVQALDNLTCECGSEAAIFKHGRIHTPHLAYINDTIQRNGFCKISSFPTKNASFYVLKTFKI